MADGRAPGDEGGSSSSSSEGEDSGGKKKRRPRLRWRKWLRALHRDFGYLAVGLTFIYALSGLAVNHLADWDPNFENFEREVTVSTPLPKGDQEAAAAVQQQVGVSGEPLDIYPVTDDLLEITLEQQTLHVTRSTGHVFIEGQEPRLFLRAANWLHLNRGKKAWTWFADGYAVVLLFLATSGIFMLSGRKGLLGRGAVLIGLGVAIPLVYLAVIGSP